jgi:exonuclease SbcC
VKAGTDSATAAGEKAAAADAALAAGLAEHGFDDVAACDGAMLSPEDLEATLAQIAAHHDALTATKAQIKQAEKSATALPKDVDVAALELQAQEANEAHTAAVQAHTQATDRLDTLLDVRKRLDQVDADHKKVDEEYAVVGVLAAVANGQGQGAKVSFQRWVLGAYLDDVLHAASKRLLMMSKGRYRLKRAMNTTDRKRASGLDLAVFDTWSNRERPAITLSGGESFLAALALALGLAETVQEQAGGTRLDTVFVDEGFGALDQDALDLAMDALVELKDTGRLVGVISHVQELRQVIDARLEVSGGSGGSHARFVVQ